MKIASLTPKQWASGQLVQIKPKLRGWLHLAAAPLSLAASIVLVCLAPTTPTKIGSAVYLACSLILFGVSATYHRFYWAPRWETAWKRMDHSNIFLLIAGTFMETSAIILICTPIFLPVVTAMGMDPVHFGIIITANTAIGLLTPPFGVCLFTAAAVAKVKIQAMFKEIIPFIVTMIIAILIITYCAPLVMFMV